MTENEAKTKWCFAYRVTSSGHYTLDNRSPNDPPEIFSRYRCIGSACMAWRWAAFAEGEEHAGNVHGYCGLAGK